jgi:branched-chain amino acid transport system substrate-binding protein
VYQKARASGLNPADQESAVVRVTAMQLSLGQADVALRTASDYFAASRKQVGDVSPEFSLLFGYAYGQRNDFDQALAWLARARAVSPPQSRFAFASQEEVAAVLRSVPEKQFEDIAAMWAGDEFIRAEIGTERLRRSRGGEVAPGEKSALVKSPLLNPGEVRLGALLPLQGRFAALGRTVQNGIELAVAGQGADPVVRLTVQDSGDTSEQAAAAAGTLAQSSQPTVVLGPLVSEQAHAVRSVLDAQGVPSLSFSKRSDFIPGAAVFRLGVTVESQVESLLATTHDRMGVTRYAVVGSSDPALTEVAEVFRRKLRELGLQLVFDKVYQRGVKDAAAALAAELENQPVEAVFFADNSALASTVYAGMSEESRKRVLPLGIGNWDNRPQLMSSRTVLNGAVFVSPFFPQSSRPIVGGFISAYRGKYGQEPDFLAAQGFDAATMVLQAAKRAQATMMPLPEAIRGIDIYDGLTGRVYVGADGELRRAFAVVQLRGDALVELNAPEAAAGQLTSGESVLNGAATAPVVAPTKGPVVAPPPPEAPTLGSVMKP